MDFDVIFWLAIVAVYLFQFLTGKKKRQTAQPQTQTGHPALRTGDPRLQGSQREEQGQLADSGSPRQGSDFRDALTEISRMLQGEMPAQPEPYRHFPEYDVETEGPGQLQPLPSPVEEESSSFGSKTSWSGNFYDDSFENKKMGSFHRPVITHDHTFDNSGILNLPDPKAGEFRKAVWANVHDHAKTREALVLAQVLGPPRARRKSHRSG